MWHEKAEWIGSRYKFFETRDFLTATLGFKRTCMCKIDKYLIFTFTLKIEVLKPFATDVRFILIDYITY